MGFCMADLEMDIHTENVVWSATEKKSSYPPLFGQIYIFKRAWNV